MTATVTRPDDVSSRVRTRKPGRGRRAKPPVRRSNRTYVVRGLLLVLAAALLWLVGGVLLAAHTVSTRAAVAQSELELFRDTLKAGDDKAAKAHLQAGEAALADATGAAGSGPVRVAGQLPYVDQTVTDLGHLLDAAGIMTGSARDALDVYENFSGDDSKLFADGKFSIPAIEQAQRAVGDIKGSLAAAEAELQQVRGHGFRGGDALDKKRSALKQIGSLRGEIVAIEPLLRAMPDAVGANGRKTYLVAIMNPAEMRASGGAPLSVAFVRFKDGKMSVPFKGATSEKTDMNSEFYWDRLTGKDDPFQLPAGEAQRFVNTTFNPDFTVSGEQMVRATPVNFGFKTDGVIALDVNAIGHLLDATGPIDTEFYGKVTGKNVAQKLIIDAYTSGSDDASVQARHDVNDQLMGVMLSRLTEGGGLLHKTRALGEAIPGRHLQLYFRDPALQHVVEEKGMAGAVPTRDTGNLTAVYTQNGNGNKLDVFQRRTVRETVRLRPDGSAIVTRTVALENPTPPYTAPFPDRLRGYDTRYATNLVINLMPPGSKVLETPTVLLTSTAVTGKDQDGRTYSQAAIMLPPDGSEELTWTFRVPHAAVVRGNEMYFRDYVVPQSMLNTPALRLNVVAPKGWTADTGTGWQATAKGVRTEVGMDHLQVLKVLLRK